MQQHTDRVRRCPPASGASALASLCKVQASSGALAAGRCPLPPLWKAGVGLLPPGLDIIIGVHREVALESLKHEEAKQGREVDGAEQGWHDAGEDIEVWVGHLSELPPDGPLPIKGWEPRKDDPACRRGVTGGVRL